MNQDYSKPQYLTENGFSRELLPKSFTYTVKKVDSAFERLSHVEKQTLTNKSRFIEPKQSIRLSPEGAKQIAQVLKVMLKS